MKKDVKKSLWILGIVLILLIVIGGTIYYYKNKSVDKLDYNKLCSDNLAYSSGGTQNGQSVSVLRVRCSDSTFEYTCIATSISGQISVYGSIFNNTFYGNYDYCAKLGLYR